VDLDLPMFSAAFATGQERNWFKVPHATAARAEL